jgi:hypothetical protein
MQVAFQPRGAGDDDRTFAVAAKAAARVAAAWGLTNAEAAALFGVSERTWSRLKTGAAGRHDMDQLMRMSGVIGLYKGLHLYFSDTLADRWPKLANSGPAGLHRRGIGSTRPGRRAASRQCDGPAACRVVRCLRRP